MTSGVTSASGPTTTSTGPAASTSTTSPQVQGPGQDADSVLFMEITKAVGRLNTALRTSNAADDDPRWAVLEGLRARTQAIMVRKSLAERKMDVADQAALQLRTTFRQAQQAQAEPTVAARLAQVQQALDRLPAPPSADTAAAKPVLDQIIEALGPLVEAAPSAGTPTT